MLKLIGSCKYESFPEGVFGTQRSLTNSKNEPIPQSIEEILDINTTFANKLGIRWRYGFECEVWESVEEEAAADLLRQAPHHLSATIQKKSTTKVQKEKEDETKTHENNKAYQQHKWNKTKTNKGWGSQP